MKYYPKRRMTRQRRYILDELRKLRCHPTAKQLLRIISKKMPSISLATVYRNLDVLVNQGIVRRLEIGESARYDADLGDHDHIRCISCGKVDDLDKLPARLKKDMINKQSQYRILGIRIDIFGLCPECIRMENTT
jgi:Fur family ferric uptake transcriptional regulator